MPSVAIVICFAISSRDFIAILCVILLLKTDDFNLQFELGSLDEKYKLNTKLFFFLIIILSADPKLLLNA